MVFDSYPGPGSQTNLTSLGNNFHPVIVPTGSSPVNDGLDNSLCATLAANTSTGYVASPANMLVNATTRWMSVGGVEGFRTMWVVGGLVAQTNYTAWLVDDQGGITESMWFSTKEGELQRQWSRARFDISFVPLSVDRAQHPMPWNSLRSTPPGEHHHLAGYHDSLPA